MELLVKKNNRVEKRDDAPCIYCGQPVGPHGRRGPQKKFCSNRCGLAHWYEENRAPHLKGHRRKRKLPEWFLQRSQRQAVDDFLQYVRERTRNTKAPGEPEANV